MKRFLGITSGALLSLLTASPAFAASVDFCSPDTTFAPLCTFRFDNIGSIIQTIITIILIIAVIIAVIFLIYGGIKWIISGGDKAAVESARGHIIAAIVGLAIALLAFFIVRVVLGLLGINVTSFNLPSIVPTPTP